MGGTEGARGGRDEEGAAVDIMTSQLIFSLYYRSLLP